jgi:ribosomal protein S12 methylthiotransferase accessory factor
MVLGGTLGLEPLREGLRRREPVVYRRGGSRSQDGAAVLARLEALMPALGITRLADISHLSPQRFPVFQTSRPAIFTHTATGQNTGSQGKGSTELQARISALMEEVESHAAEPRDVRLMRGDYRRLSSQHVLAFPRSFVHIERTGRAGGRTPLVWLEGHSIEHGCGVWLPAETVLFPFCPEDYHTESFFPCSTNGLAAGASYLEATLHGLYEVIERCYQAFHEIGQARPVRLDPAELDLELELDRDVTVELEAVLLERGQTDLPFVIARLAGIEGRYAGYGLSCSLGESVERAVSEVLQALAVDVSGGREDLEDKRGRARAPRLPAATLPLAELSARIVDTRFDDLHDELLHAVDWLHRFGLPNVIVANLTRAGVEVPVVKVVVPGLPCKASLRRPAAPIDARRLAALRFVVEEEPA